MRLTGLIGLIFLISLYTPGALAQTNPPDKDEVIKVDTQLVDVPLAVTTPAGLPVKSLKVTNFVLYEDDKPQEIVDFSSTSAPFEVALLLDTSGSTRSDIQLIQRAAMDFIASLRPGDRVSITAFRTDRDERTSFAVSQVLTGLTSDRALLKSAIERAGTSNGTPYYDSLVEIAQKVFRDTPGEEFRGRRALVALSDGVDSTSSTDFAETKERLNTLGLICFFIKVDTRDFFEEGLMGDCQSATRFSSAQIRRYYRSINAKANFEKAVNFCQLGEFERLAISKKLYEIAEGEMTELAKSSGGKVFPVAELSDARNAFKSVADEIGTKYTLGYYPSNEKRDGKFRRIRVELKGLPKGTMIRAREGYMAPLN